MMRRIILAAALCLGLGGCITASQLGTVLTLGTASVANPVTAERLQQIEAVETLVFTALVQWKRACIRGDIPDSCKQQIRTVQIFTKQIPPYQAQLRGFVRTNDQVNATVLFNVITDLIGQAKSHAAAAGQALGS